MGRIFKGLLLNHKHRQEMAVFNLDYIGDYGSMTGVIVSQSLVEESDNFTYLFAPPVWLGK